MSFTGLSHRQLLDLLTLQQQVGAHGVGPTGRQQNLAQSTKNFASGLASVQGKILLPLQDLSHSVINGSLVINNTDIINQL